MVEREALPRSTRPAPLCSAPARMEPLKRVLLCAGHHVHPAAHPHVSPPCSIPPAQISRPHRCVLWGSPVDSVTSLPAVWFIQPSNTP